MDTNTFMFEKIQPTELFIKCAIPATLSMIFSGIYSIADGIFVGRCIGADALAAVNLVMPLIMISFALAEMIAVGSAVQLAMLLGQKEKELANRTFSVCIKVILGISVIIGLMFFFLSKPILMLMGTEGMALQYSIEYIRVYAVFSPLIIVYFAADNYLRICGRQNYSMALNIVTAVLNIVLDFLLLVVWKQGVWAAAFTSCISMALGTVMALCPFFRNKLELKFVKGWISAKQFVKLVANGSSEFFANIASSIFSFILNIVLLSIGGATAVAAMSVVMYVEGIASMMISGMSDSMQPAISYCHGAGLKEKGLCFGKAGSCFGGGSFAYCLSAFTLWWSVGRAVLCEVGRNRIIGAKYPCNELVCVVLFGELGRWLFIWVLDCVGTSRKVVHCVHHGNTGTAAGGAGCFGASAGIGWCVLNAFICRSIECCAIACFGSHDKKQKRVAYGKNKTNVFLLPLSPAERTLGLFAAFLCLFPLFSSLHRLFYLL